MVCIKASTERSWVTSAINPRDNLVHKEWWKKGLEEDCCTALSQKLVVGWVAGLCLSLLLVQVFMQNT